jgi:DNA-binding GntR family transcriptional regulator
VTNAHNAGSEMVAEKRSSLTIDRTTAGLDVLAQLREAITSAQLLPGAKLREVALSRELGVGRAPIREALRQLTQEGLVTYEPHRGSFVSIVSAADLADVYVAREAIEVRAVEAILDGGPGGGDEEILAALEQLRRAPELEQPSVRIIEADIGLHGAIVRAAGSPRLDRMFRTLSAETRMYLLHTHPPINRETYVAQHADLVELIVNRDPRSAGAISEHLVNARKLVSATIAPDPAPQAREAETTGGPPR